MPNISHCVRTAFHLSSDVLQKFQTTKSDEIYSIYNILVTLLLSAKHSVSKNLHFQLVETLCCDFSMLQTVSINWIFIFHISYFIFLSEFLKIFHFRKNTKKDKKCRAKFSNDPT